MDSIPDDTIITYGYNAHNVILRTDTLTGPFKIISFMYKTVNFDKLNN